MTDRSITLTHYSTTSEMNKNELISLLEPFVILRSFDEDGNEKLCVSINDFQHNFTIPSTIGENPVYFVYHVYWGSSSNDVFCFNSREQAIDAVRTSKYDGYCFIDEEFGKDRFISLLERLSFQEGEEMWRESGGSF